MLLPGLMKVPTFKLMVAGRIVKKRGLVVSGILLLMATIKACDSPLNKKFSKIISVGVLVDEYIYLIG